MNFLIRQRFLFVLLIATSLVVPTSNRLVAEEGILLESAIDDGQYNELIDKAYMWGWPMVYLTNMHKSLSLVSTAGISGGAPVAPINRLSMLTETVTPEFSSIPCPNPDLIYGFAMLDLSEQPVILQIPDVRDRVWMIQVGDHRTDSFGQFGSMYGTAPGFYAIVGPDWKGPIPDNISAVVRSPTNLAYAIPRFHSQGAATESLSETLSRLAVYPLDQFNGKWKRRNWTKPKWYPQIGRTTRERSRFVRPDTFFKDLQLVLDSVPPLAGEEAFYMELRQLLELQDENAEFARLLVERANELESQEIAPLFDFRRVGSQLQNNWTTVNNGANFGTDYQTRTAVAKSNTFVNRPNEAKYFHLEQDRIGNQLSGNQAYQITFSKDQLPPNDGFWSLTVYNEDHFLVPHPSQINSTIGGAESSLKKNADSSVTVIMQRQPPANAELNWLPIPAGEFVLYLRVYCPAQSVIDGKWQPPAVNSIEVQKPRQLLTHTHAQTIID